MQRGIRPFVILTAFALGCVATSTVVSTSQASSDATPDPGSTTCATWYIQPPRVRDAPVDVGAKGMVTLPPGWEPVGGGPTDNIDAVVIACRRS